MNLMAAFCDGDPASCVRKTAESSVPPKYRCSRNLLSITWPSHCVQTSLILHLQRRILVSRPNGDTPICVARGRRKKNITASEAGLELDLRFARAWGRALVAHILA